jgi:hypothetical protein
MTAMCLPSGEMLTELIAGRLPNASTGGAADTDGQATKNETANNAAPSAHIREDMIPPRKTNPQDKASGNVCCLKGRRAKNKSS